MAVSESSPFKRVIIVGAGFSGLAMACQLKQKLRCHDFVIYDRGAGFGGTWFFNTCMTGLYHLPSLGQIPADGHPRPRVWC